MACRNQRFYLAKVKSYYTLEMTHVTFGKGTRSLIDKHLINAYPRWFKIANKQSHILLSWDSESRRRKTQLVKSDESPENNENSDTPLC